MMTPLRPVVALDYTSAAGQGAGIGRITRETVAALATEPRAFEVRLFVSGARTADLPPPPGAGFVWRTTPIAPRWLARAWRLGIPLPIETFTGAIDLYHATDFVLPPVRAKRSIVTVHDLSFITVPEAASSSLKRYLDRVVPRSVARASHVIADSAATKADLIRLYHTPTDRITVIYPGADARFRRVDDPAARAAVRTKYKLTRPYLLAVGTVQPRKNYARLAEALAIVRASGIDVDLAIAGGRGWLEDPIYAAVERAGMRDHVHFLGFADDADLPALYSEAITSAMPALYEGFGIPVLEAMQCGTPAITSNVSSLPEVGGDAALLVDPLDTKAIAAAIERVVTDSTLREGMIARGYVQAARFSWARAADELAALYERLLRED